MLCDKQQVFLFDDKLQWKRVLSKRPRAFQTWVLSRSRSGERGMGDEATDRLRILCDKIANETDPEKLAALAKELDDWLAEDEELRRKLKNSAGEKKE